MKVDYKQQEFRHPMLRAVLAWVEKATGFDFTETSSHRVDDPGVHGCGRGSDLRCRNYMVGKSIEKLINSEWQYDPERKKKQCCVLHGEGSNLHLHIQVHPNTVRR